MAKTLDIKHLCHILFYATTAHMSHRMLKVCCLCLHSQLWKWRPHMKVHIFTIYFLASSWLLITLQSSTSFSQCKVAGWRSLPLSNAHFMAKFFSLSLSFQINERKALAWRLAASNSSSANLKTECYNLLAIEIWCKCTGTKECYLRTSCTDRASAMEQSANWVMAWDATS